MVSVRPAAEHATQVAIIALLFVVYVAALSVKTVTGVVKRRLTGGSTPVESARAPPEL